MKKSLNKHFFEFIAILEKAGISRGKAIQLFLEVFKKRDEILTITETVNGEPGARSFIVMNKYHKQVATIFQPPVVDPSVSDCVIIPTVKLSASQKEFILKRLEPFYV